MPGTARMRSSTSCGRLSATGQLGVVERHGDDRVAILVDRDVVDQPELVDVDRDFGVVDRLERLDHRGLEVAAGAVRRLGSYRRRRGSRRDSRACARRSRQEFRVRPRARRGGDAVDFLDLDLAFSRSFRKIRFTCSMPRTSASMSPRSLCAAKLARAVAATPSSFHQRLRAMVTGADRDARIVQYGGGVVRVHPLDVEADDSGAVVGAVERHAADARQRVAAFGDQRGFVRVDRVDAEILRPSRSPHEARSRRRYAASPPRTASADRDRWFPRK